MSGGRSHPPLFEILSRSNRGDTIGRRGHDSARSEPPGPGGEREAGGSRPRGRLSIPVYAVYAAISVALMAGLGIWAVAYRVGRGAGERAAQQQLEIARPPLARPEDPLLGDSQGGGGPLNGGGVNGRKAGDGEGASSASARVDAGPGRGSAGEAGEGAVGDVGDAGTTGGAGDGPRVLTHRGRLASDPRRGATNYLKLESGVPRDEAERLLRFLGSRGIEAIAVGAGVEAGGESANNQARVSIYSLRGIPSGEWTVRAEQARRHKALVQRLGREWKRAHDGSVALADPLWERYEP